MRTRKHRPPHNRLDHKALPWPCLCSVCRGRKRLIHTDTSWKNCSWIGRTWPDNCNIHFIGVDVGICLDRCFVVGGVCIGSVGVCLRLDRRRCFIVGFRLCPVGTVDASVAASSPLERGIVSLFVFRRNKKRRSLIPVTMMTMTMTILN